MFLRYGRKCFLSGMVNIKNLKKTWCIHCGAEEIRHRWEKIAGFLLALFFLFILVFLLLHFLGPLKPWAPFYSPCYYPFYLQPGKSLKCFSWILFLFIGRGQDPDPPPPPPPPPPSSGFFEQLILIISCCATDLNLVFGQVCRQGVRFSTISTGWYVLIWSHLIYY